MSRKNQRNIACFISPHGLGHATRAAAVLAALQSCEPHARLHLFTTAYPALFETSGCRNKFFHDLPADVGFAQTSAFVSDLPETIRRLDAFLPFDPAHVKELAATIVRAGCGIVLCDIAPLGIAVAREAGIPSVLVENFVWSDLYRHYGSQYPRMTEHADYLQGIFRQASLHIQTDPICQPAEADLIVGPISRAPRQSRTAIRKALAIGQDCRLILVTLGGDTHHPPPLSHLASRADLIFVTIAAGDGLRRTGNVLHIPPQSDFYHPDIVHAADAVIGKVGYSTLAEVYHAGVPFGYVARKDYPEMPPLVAFIEREMAALPVSAAELEAGITADRIDALINLPHRPPARPNGAGAVATFLAPLLRRPLRT